VVVAALRAEGDGGRHSNEKRSGQYDDTACDIERIYIFNQAVAWLSRSVAGFVSSRPGLDPRSGDVCSVAGVGQRIHSLRTSFPCQAPTLYVTE
jgi:hypothetical protein